MRCEDQQLYAWFLRRGQPADPALGALVAHILEHNAAHAHPR
jgi:succinate dehydrogenase flavin-adding protein (antitoxin of CptAB toxin-antitoxin module)